MNQCTRCAHQWNPHGHVSRSRNCPKCKSPYWDVPRRVKEFFDPNIHTDDRKRLLEYIDVVHQGNLTAAAYFIGVEYPYLYKLVKHWRVVPPWIIEKISTLGQMDAPKRMTVKTMSLLVDFDAPVIIPPGFARWTEKDYITPLPPQAHIDDCMAFRRIIESEYQGDVRAFARKHGMTVANVKDIYTGAAKVPAIFKGLTIPW